MIDCSYPLKKCIYLSSVIQLAYAIFHTVLINTVYYYCVHVDITNGNYVRYCVRLPVLVCFIYMMCFPHAC